MKTKDYYLNKLIEVQQLDDIEAIHVKADDVLLEILKDLGFDDIVEQYNKIEMWYA